MLTRQQIIDTFIKGINEIPGDELIEAYADYTQEQLDAIIERNLAIRKDPTFVQRVAEDYHKFMAATDEERAVWIHPSPNPAP